MTKCSNDFFNTWQLENERVRKSFRALINTSRMISILIDRVEFCVVDHPVISPIFAKKNHPRFPGSPLRPMQFRYWPWLIHVDLAWRLSRENTRVPHDRDYASLEFIVSQLLASRDVRLEILRRISGLDSTPIKIKLALTTRNVLQISLLPSCLHARPATALSVYWYVRTHTHTHTYVHARTYIHTRARVHASHSRLLWRMLRMRVTSYQSTRNAFQARFSILSLRITWINVFKGIYPPFHLSSLLVAPSSLRLFSEPSRESVAFKIG